MLEISKLPTTSSTLLLKWIFSTLDSIVFCQNSVFTCTSNLFCRDHRVSKLPTFQPLDLFVCLNIPKDCITISKVFVCLLQAFQNPEGLIKNPQNTRITQPQFMNLSSWKCTGDSPIAIKAPIGIHKQKWQRSFPFTSNTIPRRREKNGGNIKKLCLLVKNMSTVSNTKVNIKHFSSTKKVCLTLPKSA